MKYATFLLFIILFYHPLLGLEAQARQTFYVDNSCTHDGDGTGETCAQNRRGRGAWNSLRAVQYCSGVNAGDIIETGAAQVSITNR